jgi:arylsulfatase A-like enzyme
MTNVALVVLDTLRKDAFDRHFGWLPGRRFENAWSTSHWTGAVHSSLFTGLYPSEAGVYAHNRSFDYPDATLVEQFRDADYRTRAYSSNVIVSPVFDFARGFAEFYPSWNVELAMTDDAVYDWHTHLREAQDPESYLRGFRDAIRDDCETLPSIRRGLEILRGNRALDYGARNCLDTVRDLSFGDEEFLYVNLMEAHAPYYPPPEHRTVGSYETTDHPLYAVTDDMDFDPGPVRQAYDDCVAYLSAVYEEIYRELEAAFDYVVTVADHGEMFGEHGFYEHTFGVFPEVAHVPVVVSGEGVPDRSEDAMVSLLDVHRTVADLGDLDAGSRGRPLLGEVSPRASLTEYHGIPHPRQVESLREWGASREEIRDFDEPRYGLHLPPAYYGFESRDGFEEQGEAPVADPREQLAHFLDDRAVRDPGDDGQALSDGVLDQLEHLGYA